MSHSIWLALPRMGELLKSDLMEAMNRLEALEKHLANSAVWEEFSQLKKHIDGFDTDSAVKSFQEIAQKLTVTEGTVAKNVSKILSKLQLENRTQIALYALRKGLVEDVKE